MLLILCFVETGCPHFSADLISFLVLFLFFLNYNLLHKISRKIVLATNIAESSITIDDVVYVVDCGKAKETSYDALNKLACLLPSWISKASAHQVIIWYHESAIGISLHYLL